MDKPDFLSAKIKAYETLIKQDPFLFPVNPKKIKICNYDTVIISLQEYSKITNTPLALLTSNMTFVDGYTYFRNSTAFIFYNEDIDTEGRKMWTISHELGHIVLNHTTQCDKNEKEANFFASQLLVPQCVLKQLVKNGVKITSTYISEKFKISKEASENCISILNKIIDNDFLITDYDDIIVEQFKPYIKTDYSLDSYFEELENRRTSFDF